MWLRLTYKQYHAILHTTANPQIVPGHTTTHCPIRPDLYFVDVNMPKRTVINAWCNPR